MGQKALALGLSLWLIAYCGQPMTISANLYLSYLESYLHSYICALIIIPPKPQKHSPNLSYDLEVYYCY